MTVRDATENTRNARRPSLREERRLLTRGRLLEAAMDMFAKHGFAATSLEDIAVAADVNRGTIYLHFKNKGELLNAILGTLDPSSFEPYRELSRPRTRKELRAIFDRAVTSWDEGLATPLMLAREASASEPGVAASMVALLGAHVDTIASVLERHGVPAGVARARAVGLACMWEEMAVARLSRTVAVPRTALRDALVDFFVAAIAPADS